MKKPGRTEYDRAGELEVRDKLTADGAANIESVFIGHAAQLSCPNAGAISWRCAGRPDCAAVKALQVGQPGPAF